MKIAAITQDGKSISSHFGMADKYLIFEVQDGQIVSQNEVDKPHHAVHPDHEAQGSRHEGHGHDDMFAPLRDCQVLLAGGMGGPAYQKALDTGLEVVLSGGQIKSALEAYLRGELHSDPLRVHKH
jgi:predicted Fe-Mo cluster-binding NifX family protein